MPLEFQLEPRLGDTDFHGDLSRIPASPNTTAEDLTAAFLGLRLRGHFIDEDVRVLRSIAVERSPLLLLTETRNLFPNSAALEHPESLAAAVRLCGDAHVSIRHRVQIDGRSSDQHITGARIGSLGDEEIILAVPENGRRDRGHQSFMQLLESFRNALGRAGDVETGLHRAHDPSAAWALIRQSTGNILAVSESFAELLGMSTGHILGRPLEPLQAELLAKRPRIQITLDQLGYAVLPLVQVRFVDVSTERQTSAETSLPELVRSIRNRVGSLAGMARHVEGMISQAPGDLPHELMRLLADEAAELDHHLLHLEHAAGERCQPACALDPAPIMRRTITELLQRHDHYSIRLGISDGGTVVAPPQLFGELIESILEAHAGPNGTRAITDIAYDQARSNRSAAITFTTSRPGTASPGVFQSDWQQQALWLAHRIGWTVRFETSPTHGILESRLTRQIEGM